MYIQNENNEKKQKTIENSLNDLEIGKDIDDVPLNLLKWLV